MLTQCTPLTPLLPDRPPLPPELTQACQPLNPLTDGRAATVLRKLVEIGQAYYDCAARHDALARAVQ